MPSDGIRELLVDTAVPLKTIESKMEKSPAGHRLLLVDACQERVSARSTNPAGEPASKAFEAAFKSPSGQAKFASCAGGEHSYEHHSLGGAGHGLFTFAFLEALRGGAIADDGNIVRLGAVSQYVDGFVKEWAKENGRSAQSPFLSSPEATRKMPLAQKGR